MITGITGFPRFKTILYGIAVAAVIGVALYATHIYKEAKRVPALVATINAQRTQIEYERTQAEDLLRRERELQVNLAAAKSRVAGLTQRLLLAAQTASSANPAPASGGDESAIPSGLEEIKRDADEAWAAASADAEKLDACYEAYETVRKKYSVELK